MKKLFLLLAALNIGCLLLSQTIGIGTATPHASAELDITSTGKGLLIPRLFETQRPLSPATGLLIYNKNSNGFQYYNGTSWVNMANSGMDDIWYKIQDSIAYTAHPYVGINTDINLMPPQANLQVTGSLLIQGKMEHSNATPTPAQTYTMNNTSGLQIIPFNDSVFRIYDPGGTGNYNNNMQGNVLMGLGGDLGFRISSNAADFGLGTGDTIWISRTSFPGCRTNYAYRFTNSSVSPGDLLVNGSVTNLIFRSNGDGVNNKGFNFFITRLYKPEEDKKIQTIGPSLYFNNANGSFAAGYNAEATGQTSLAMGNKSVAQGNQSIAIGSGAISSGEASIAIGFSAEASGDFSFAAGYDPNALGQSSTAMGGGTTATGELSTAMGNSTNATGTSSTAMGNSTIASGNTSTAMGNNTIASGSHSTAMGFHTFARGFASTVVGMYSDPIVSSQTSVTSTTPLFIVGNGDAFNLLENAMVVLKNGNIGVGTNSPDADLHIVHAGGGGLILENGNDLNRWRIYSASGDNNLTFYNDADTEVADIDNATGTFNAISDLRLKKNIEDVPPVLDQLMRLQPKHYHFNWQQGDEQKQLGFLAQEVNKLFPELVSYSKEKDLYKMNYAGFSTVAIKAIQEQQQVIQDQQQEIDALRTRLDKLEAALLKK
jgi:hypothetical protein